MAKTISEKETCMLYGIRCIGLAVILAHYLVLAPLGELKAQEIEGKSTVFDLSKLEEDDSVKKNVARYELALGQLGKAADAGKKMVLNAMKEFESRPSRKNESLLIKANVEAISLLFHAHKEYQAAVKEAGRAIEVVVGRMEEGKEIIRQQVESLAKHKAETIGEAERAERELDSLAENLEQLVDSNGNLDPELDSTVRRLDRIYKQKLQKLDDIEAAKTDVEYDHAEIVGLMSELRRKQIKLKDSELDSTLTLGRLSWISGNLDRTVRNRQILDGVRGLEKLVPVDKIFLPPTHYPKLPRLKAKRSLPVSKGAASLQGKGLEILKRRKESRSVKAKLPSEKDAPSREKVKPSSGASQAQIKWAKNGGKVD